MATNGYDDESRTREREEDDVVSEEEEESEEDRDKQEEEEEEEDDEEEMEQDADYVALTQQIEANTDRDVYDPSQDKEERREIRQQYRKLISRTEENRRDYVHSKNNGLFETLEKANDLYARVKNTQEATLDSRLQVLLADLGTQKARNLRLDHQNFSIDEFVSKVKTFGSAGREEGCPLNWKAIGQRAVAYGQRAQTIDFMLGPLSVERKQRKVARYVRLVKNKEDLVQPTKLEESDIQQQENETSANVNKIYKILDEHGPVNYLEFITNPHSFSQTVENMFYVSFLIRNAVAEIDDSSGQPILSTRAPPTTDELADNLSKKQLIMNMDIALWKNIIQVYGIRNPIIPTRAEPKGMTSGKWY